MSPLSDTTNLAPALAGTDLFTHIRYMLYTTVPSITIALIVFGVAGFSFDIQSEAGNVDGIITAMTDTFHITPWLFVVPVIVILMILRKVPAIPALLVGALLGGVAACIFQPELMSKVSQEMYVALDDPTTEANEIDRIPAIVQQAGLVLNSMASGQTITSGVDEADRLLEESGMSGMLNTIWLILCALSFGGALQAAGMLRRITQALLTGVKTVGGLVARTAGSCLIFNLTASDQYIAIVVPGKMFAEAYANRGLAPENLSRTLEDTGTVTSALIPWNTCGLYHSTKLGVDVLTYLPFCVFNYVSPLMTIIFAVFRFKIRTLRERIQGEDVALADINS